MFPPNPPPQQPLNLGSKPLRSLIPRHFRVAANQDLGLCSFRLHKREEPFFIVACATRNERKIHGVDIYSALLGLESVEDDGVLKGLMGLWVERKPGG